jgi:zinc protease
MKPTSQLRALLFVVFWFFCSLLAVSAQAQEPASSPAPQATPPPPAAPRSLTVPKPVERTLKNGLRVIVIEHHSMPLVAAQLIIKNGSEADPAGLSGIADITAELLTKGSKTRTAPQIAQEIEALGGVLSSSAGWDASRASINVISSKTEPAMAILADVVRNPVFKDEEIERLRQQYLDNLSVGMNTPGTLASWVASRVVFGDAPYGHSLSGTRESIAGIKRANIADLHSQYYRPDNAILVIGGDIKGDDAFKLADRLFGDWASLPTAPDGPAKGATAVAAQALGNQRIVVVDMPGAGQAAVVFARSGIARTDPAYFSGIVANAVLTGYSGRLNQEIRIKRGLSYGAGSSLQARREGGLFVASAQTKNQSGAEVASLLVGELRRLSNETVGETELIPRKAVLIGSFGRALETTEGLVGQIAALALYGLRLDETNSYINRVQAISAADIQRFGGTSLNSKGASIIIVGDAKEFLPELQKQFKDIEVIPIAELDLNNAGLRKSKAGAKNQ